MKEIRGYVVRSVLSTLGVSLYILADTFFIANGVGTLGLTALNIALPLFSLLNGLGLLLGMGGATLFTLNNGKGNVFSQLVLVGSALGIFFGLIGFFLPGQVASLLGASAATHELTTLYLRFIMTMAPFFILNNLVLAFIRNDRNPQLAMKAMVVSSLFNIVFDYIFVFPLDMGMAGAALATVLSPVLSLLILSSHRRRSNRRLVLAWVRPQFKTVMKSVQLGLSSFLMEMSTGVSILVFNMVLLSLAGDIAVAAYGVLANIVIVALALFTGVAQGIQPLVSQKTQQKDHQMVDRYLNYGLRLSLTFAAVLYVFLLLFKLPVIGLFNGENNQELTRLAAAGMPIYFVSLFASSINVVLSIFFSAVGRAKESFGIAILRGYLLILPAVILLGRLVGLTGVWASLPLVEFLTLIVAVWLLGTMRKKRGAQELTMMK